jgi:hypothetical protein
MASALRLSSSSALRASSRSINGPVRSAFLARAYSSKSKVCIFWGHHYRSSWLTRTVRLLKKPSPPACLKRSSRLRSYESKPSSPAGTLTTVYINWHWQKLALHQEKLRKHQKKLVEHWWRYQKLLPANATPYICILTMKLILTSYLK